MNRLAIILSSVWLGFSICQFLINIIYGRILESTIFGSGIFIGLFIFIMNIVEIVKMEYPMYITMKKEK